MNDLGLLFLGVVAFLAMGGFGIAYYIFKKWEVTDMSDIDLGLDDNVIDINNQLYEREKKRKQSKNDKKAS